MLLPGGLQPSATAKVAYLRLSLQLDTHLRRLPVCPKYLEQKEVEGHCSVAVRLWTRSSSCSTAHDRPPGDSEDIVPAILGMHAARPLVVLPELQQALLQQLMQSDSGGLTFTLLLLPLAILVRIGSIVTA